MALQSSGLGNKSTWLTFPTVLLASLLRSVSFTEGSFVLVANRPFSCNCKWNLPMRGDKKEVSMGASKTGFPSNSVEGSATLGLRCFSSGETTAVSSCAILEASCKSLQASCFPCTATNVSAKSRAEHDSMLKFGLDAFVVFVINCVKSGCDGDAVEDAWVDDITTTTMNPQRNNVLPEKYLFLVSIAMCSLVIPNMTNDPLGRSECNREKGERRLQIVSLMLWKTITTRSASWFFILVRAKLFSKRIIFCVHDERLILVLGFVSRTFCYESYTTGKVSNIKTESINQSRTPISWRLTVRILASKWNSNSIQLAWQDSTPVVKVIVDWIQLRLEYSLIQ